ncbi:unnamed protein product [Rhizophagus irregularis]|uniref:Uncharacterized protein n=1 Tax=Rhizophagus irregularis (strain DAOM 197198w) TaxID=1432141 RepID=A0A015JU04_RHIIW|nr:hypothetical protein RirG_084320 [Rhizophagus irregularis DAOM 197198w]CAB4493249.1 unnamed protein product [Rhizophagus irregularis]
MVRYRDLLNLTENHTLSWIDLYNQHLVEINDAPNDLIEPAVDDIQEVMVTILMKKTTTHHRKRMNFELTGCYWLK